MALNTYMESILHKNFSSIKVEKPFPKYIKDLIKSKNHKTIGIYGPSCGGKTTFSYQLLDELGEDSALLISVDDYWKYNREDMKRLNLTGYDWDSRDKDKFIKDIELLKNGKSIKKPVFDYINEKPTQQHETVKSREIILLEATLDFSSIADLIIFTYADDKIITNRRLERDKDKTGFSGLEELKEYIKTKSIPAYKNRLVPLLPFTHFAIDTHNNVIYKNKRLEGKISDI